MIGVFFETVGRWMIRHCIILSIISFFIGWGLSAVIHVEPVKQSSLTITATPVAEPVKNCVNPKFIIGEKVKSVLPKWTDDDGKDIYLLAQIITVDGISETNNTCLYTVGWYNSIGEWQEASMYEFGLTR